MASPLPFGAPPRRAVLPDGRRRHFQHGPIDLVIEAFGAEREAARAYDQAWARFETVLGELVGELAELRRPVSETKRAPAGATAQRMYTACRPHSAAFVTPMAAVAGSVADEVLEAMLADRRLDKAYVNNGGDIALHLCGEASFRAGMVALAETPEFGGIAELDASSPARGIATSGWRGRSLSLGIADSVTVLARNAAAADVAATLIANAVDVDDPAIERTAATELDPDSDLGGRLVTVGVGTLAPERVACALDRGEAAARAMLAAGGIVAASLALAGTTRLVGTAGRAALGHRTKEHAAA